jgi:AcrR family transcriptional regulator
MSRPPTDPPRQRLTREAILDGALQLIDREGLDALTMRSLADRLGVVPMALYRHVANKDDLIDGVLDHAAGEVVVPAPGLGWREGLDALARSIRDTMLRHPAIAARVIDRPTLGPASILIGEYGLGLLCDGGFDARTAERGLNLVVVYALGFVALEVPRLPSSAIALDESELVAAYDALPVDEFPHTTAIRPRPGAIVDEEQFEFGLTCILDGIAGRSVR